MLFSKRGLSVIFAISGLVAQMEWPLSHLENDFLVKHLHKLQIWAQAIVAAMLYLDLRHATENVCASLLESLFSFKGQD